MSDQERAEASAIITKTFLESAPLPAPGEVFSSYSPFNYEVDVSTLTQTLIDRGCICTLPHTDDKQQRLTFLEWDGKSPLVMSVFGIYEPDARKSAEHIPHFMLMPLVAFDKSGNRLGYGSGNFDRSFEFLKKIQSFVTVGVAFEAQCFDHVPTDIHDYPMDMVITEKNVYDFRHLRAERAS